MRTSRSRKMVADATALGASVCQGTHFITVDFLCLMGCKFILFSFFKTCYTGKNAVSKHSVVQRAYCPPVHRRCIISIP